MTTQQTGPATNKRRQVCRRIDWVRLLLFSGLRPAVPDLRRPTTNRWLCGWPQRRASEASRASSENHYRSNTRRAIGLRLLPVMQVEHDSRVHPPSKLNVLVHKPLPSLLAARRTDDALGLND